MCARKRGKKKTGERQIRENDRASHVKIEISVKAGRQISWQLTPVRCLPNFTRVFAYKRHALYIAVLVRCDAAYPGKA